MEHCLFSWYEFLRAACVPHILKVFENKKVAIQFCQWQGLPKPYQHYVMWRQEGHPGHQTWLACPSIMITMVTGDLYSLLHVEQSIGHKTVMM